MRLASFPRFPLTTTPTPLTRARNLELALGPGCPRIYIKRDDLTGLAFGGNKARKLEYLVADAIAHGATTLVTEGALKADVADCFLPGYFTFASSGVSCSHELIVNLARGKPLLLAFDNDYQDNPAVLRQLAKLLKLRLQYGMEQEIQNSTKIISWSRAEKGIDDALLKGEKLEELTVADWYSTLGDKSREEVRTVWNTQN